MKRLSFLAVLTVLPLAMGCAKHLEINATPMTTGEFYEKCIFPGGRDLCGNDQDVCNDFQVMLSSKFASLKACTKACDDLQFQEADQYAVQDCGAVIGGASDLCEQFCHRNYGK